MIALAFILFAAGILRLLVKALRDKNPIRAAAALIVGFTIVVLSGIAIGPMPGGIRQAPESAVMQTTRTLAIAMFQYANDNSGAYPSGASSTEAFQKLIDGNYVTDPRLFYLPMPGKKPAVPGEKLKPENVCYDVTSGVDLTTTDALPIVFVTGFRIEYRADGSAVSLIRPFPKHHDVTSWMPWSYVPFNGLAVAFHSNNAFFFSPGLLPPPARETEVNADGYGEVLHLLPLDFDAHGKTYRQLTPEGVLK